MTNRLLTVEDFRASAKDGTSGETDMVVLQQSNKAPVVVEGTRRIGFVFSDGSVDRATDTIDPEGWDLKNFKKNPIALWAHDSSQVRNIMGNAKNVRVKDGQLVGEIDFLEAELNQDAEQVFQLVSAGIIKAVSVGFRPKEYAWSEDKERPYGIDFIKHELLEISVCPVPCNANALVLARSMGLKTTVVEAWLDAAMRADDRGIRVPRALLEATFRAAKTPRAVQVKYLTGAGSDDPEPAWTCAADKSLPVPAVTEYPETYDAPSAAARIFTACGFDGDVPDAEQARKGFLIYDASNPTLRASYKLPFADIVDGKLMAVAPGIRAAATRLPQTDASPEALEAAKGILSDYEPRLAPALITRAGAKLSAQTKTVLKACINHHAEATACLEALLNDEEMDPLEMSEKPPETKDEPEEKVRLRVRRANAIALLASLETDED